MQPIGDQIRTMQNNVNIYFTKPEQSTCIFRYIIYTYIRKRSIGPEPFCDLAKTHVRAQSQVENPPKIDLSFFRPI